MGSRKIPIRPQVAEEIARIAFFVESKGMPETVIKFTKKVMGFFRNLNSDLVEFPFCRDQIRASLGLKCIPYTKNYTTVFYQLEDEVIIMEFIPSKMIHW
jgi:hypothetical protein